MEILDNICSSFFVMVRSCGSVSNDMICNDYDYSSRFFFFFLIKLVSELPFNDGFIHDGFKVVWDFCGVALGC